MQKHVHWKLCTKTNYGKRVAKDSKIANVVEEVMERREQLDIHKDSEEINSAYFYHCRGKLQDWSVPEVTHLDKLHDYCELKREEESENKRKYVESQQEASGLQLYSSSIGALYYLSKQT